MRRMLARLPARLLALLFPPRADEAIVGELAPDALLALLDPEAVPLGGASAAALLPFTDRRVRAAIHEAKYRGNAHAFSLLAEVLAEYLREAMLEERLGEVVLVPIPLGAARRKERGFNQVEEVLKIAASELGLALEPHLLLRTRETLSQVSLPRWQRKKNMRSAFACARELTSAEKTLSYMIVDDVLTTGATLEAALAAFKNAGAVNILPIALAH